MKQPVLIVDDEEGMLHMLGFILERAGYKTLTADNGIDALEMIQQHHPAIVILDDMMPGLTGSEVCIKIKADETLRHIPIVMHSAAPQIQSETYIRRIGADAALMKPCPPRKMLEAIANFIVH
jgi:CheY-like chemotaxis protein